MECLNSEQHFDRIAFAKGNNIFFESFVLDGHEKDILGIEKIPCIVEACGICICLSGSVKVVIESRSYQLRKGDMCVVFPHTLLHVTEKSEDFLGYTIACTPEFIMRANITSGTPVYLHIKDNPCISLKEDEQKDLIRLCDMLKEYDERENNPCRDEISRFIASAIIYEVIGIYKKKEPIKQEAYSRKNKFYFEFMELLSQDFKKERNVDYYAGKLCITSRHLSAICKEITGSTANECIARHVMVNARLLLATTDLSVQQISEELTFPNPSFFSQFFKKYEGNTPKVYRSMNRT